MLGPQITPRVKVLIIACVGTFLLQLLAGREVELIFGLRPAFVLSKFFLWQLGTYLFLHGGLGHLLINMLILWMFGSEMERYLGSRRFLQFYFITGVGAGVLSVLADPSSQIPIIGASGAIYGILMAYGMLFPDRLVYLYFLFPIKVKYLVAVLGAIALVSALGAPGSNIAHVAHLGGMVFAFLYLRGWLFPSNIKQAYYRWRLNRMRRKFKVYESERRRKEDDFWIN